MKYKTIILDSKRYVSDLLHRNLSPGIEFHNLNHTKSVVKTSKLMAGFYGLSEMETTILIISSWFHDVGHIVEPKGHEIISQNILQEFLKKRKASFGFIKKCSQCIMATHINSNPRNQLEAIIRDADFSHIADTMYWDLNKRLKKEIEFINRITLPEQKWYENNLEFLSSLSFCTDYYDIKFNGMLSQRIRENLTILEAL